VNGSDLNVKAFPLKQVSGKPDDFKSTRHTAALVGTKVYIFGGGHSYPPIKSNTTWTFDTVAHKWEKVECIGNPPTARSDHSVAVVGKKLYYFGGSDQTVTPLNDLHVFDTENLTWSEVVAKGTAPSPRSGHSSVAMGNKVYVYGGARWDAKKSQWHSKSSDLFVYDTVSNTWTKPTTTGTIPKVTTFATLFAYGRHIWIVGGAKLDGDSVSETIYAYDTITNEWSVPLLKGNFRAKDCISATVIGNYVFLFGGFRSSPVNELQILEMSWNEKYSIC